MFILILLLCAAANAATPIIPPIDGIDRTGFFNYMMLEFDSRRLFVNIVDTVSSGSPSSDRMILPTSVAIGLQPSEKQPEYYGFVSRKIAEEMGCLDASNAEFENDASEPEYVLTVDESNTLEINRDDENSGDKWANGLLERVAVQAGMAKEEASKIELQDCWYVRSPEMMQLNVAVGGGPRIKAGWIVERYPLGNFLENPELNYRHPVYLTNYSYVDGFNNAIVDVQEAKDGKGKSVWTPTGWPAFARVRMEQVAMQNTTDFTMFRETETGVLVTTLAQTMFLSYSINDESFTEQLTLDGHYYHVSCDRKQGARRKHLVYGDPLTNTTTNNGVDIKLISPDGNATFHCSAKRATPTGIPELLQLDHIQQSGSHPIPSADRNVSIRKIDMIREEATTTTTTPTLTPDQQKMFSEISKALEEMVLERAKNQRAGDNKRHNKAANLPADIQQEEEKPLTELILMLVVVSVLALTTVICLGACVRSHIRKSRNPMAKVSVSDRPGEEKRRKDGLQVSIASSRPSNSAINNKSEEEEEIRLSTTPTRSNSGKKKSISFAPCKPNMKTEDLVKMIADTELGTRIDAMVAAGPDGEDEEEMQSMQQEITAAPAATAEVVDEPSSALKLE